MGSTLRCILIAAGLLATMTARAGLIGDTVKCEHAAAGCTPSQATVSAGAEFDLVGFWSIDLSDAGVLRIDNKTGTFVDVPSNYTIVLTDLTHPFTSATYFDSFLPFFDASDVKFDSGAVTIDMSGTRWQPTSFIIVDLTTGPGTTAVPEPATLALLGMGLVGIITTRRRVAT